MKSVFAAVLLDDEARGPSGLSDPNFGHLREPMLRLVQWGRTFGIGSATDAWNIGNTFDASSSLGQCPLRSPSVFNFFRPGYVPPNSQLGTNNVTAPEFQLCNESTVAGYLNYMQGLIGNGVGDMKPDYTADLALVADAPALVRRQALLMGGGDISEATITTIATAVATIKVDTDTNKLNRVKASWLMVLAAPEYQVQK
jgi:uncharacterized protein (DUF1800 family)